MQDVKDFVGHGGEKSKLGVSGVKASSVVTSGVGEDKHNSVAGDVGSEETIATIPAAVQATATAGIMTGSEGSNWRIGVGGLMAGSADRLLFSCRQMHIAQLSIQDKRCILSAKCIAAGHGLSSKSVSMKKK